MLSWAITFLIITTTVAVLGFGGITGAATGIAKILFVLFLVLFVVPSFFGRRRGQLDAKEKAMRLMRNLMNALLLGAAASSLAVAVDRDGECRLNELQSTDTGYHKAQQNLMEDENRLPGWAMNLSGTATPIHAVDGQGGKYLVSGLCEKSDCRGQRLLVASGWDKSHAYELYVQVPEGLPQDKSPSRHASFRWLGKPEPAVQKILDEQLRADPNWY